MGDVSLLPVRAGHLSRSSRGDLYQPDRRSAVIAPRERDRLGVRGPNEWTFRQPLGVRTPPSAVCPALMAPEQLTLSGTVRMYELNRDVITGSRMIYKVRDPLSIGAPCR